MLHEGGFSGFGVLVHGAELVHLEAAAVFADAGLREEDRARGVQLDGRGDEEEDHGGDEEADDGADDVEGALCGHPAHLRFRLLDGEDRGVLLHVGEVHAGRRDVAAVGLLEVFVEGFDGQEV